MSVFLTRDYPAEYRFLEKELEFDQGLNHTPMWSAGADFLALLIRAMEELKPELVIECSSGLTTLVLARCCERNGGGYVVSLENGAEYAARTRQALRAYRLGLYAQVLDAPLVEVELDGERYHWYDTGALPGDRARLLVVDGPPGFLQPQSRYPALPLLRDHLREDAVILLDDAARPDEQVLLRRWLARSPGASYRYTASERGAAMLSLGGRFSRNCCGGS